MATENCELTRLLLLDLEETILPVFGEFVPITKHCRKIRAFNETFNADEVGLFSWALWSKEDVDKWHPEKELFEQTLNLTFHHAWTIQDFIAWIRHHGGPSNMQDMDFFDFFDKERALFQLMLNGWQNGKHVVLFDDSVKPCEVDFGHSKLTIHNIFTFES